MVHGVSETHIEEERGYGAVGSVQEQAIQRGTVYAVVMKEVPSSRLTEHAVWRGEHFPRLLCT